MGLTDSTGPAGVEEQFLVGLEKIGGNADVFEKQGLAKKGICTGMKPAWEQIDGVEASNS